MGRWPVTTAWPTSFDCCLTRFATCLRSEPLPRQELARLCHSIKALAGMELGHEDTVAVAHAAEETLQWPPVAGQLLPVARFFSNYASRLTGEGAVAAGAADAVLAQLWQPPSPGQSTDVRPTSASRNARPKLLSLHATRLRWAAAAGDLVFRVRLTIAPQRVRLVLQRLGEVSAVVDSNPSVDRLPREVPLPALDILVCGGSADALRDACRVDHAAVGVSEVLFSTAGDSGFVAGLANVQEAPWRPVWDASLALVEDQAWGVPRQPSL